MVAQSKPMMFLVSKIENHSSTALGSSASHSPGTLKAHSSNSDRTCTERPVARGLNENTASSSQVWHSDADTITSRWRPVAETTKKTSGAKLSHHNFEISRNNVGSLEKVYSNVRRKLGRPQGGDMPDIDISAMMGESFYVSDNEGGSASWTRLPRESAYNEEHGRRKGQTFVRYFAENDPESEG